MRTAQFVHFGSIVMEQGRCSACGDQCLITKSGRSSCCHDQAVPLTNERHHFETEIAKRKTSPLKMFQKAYILRQQENRCFWCSCPFGSWVWHPRHGKKEVRPEWDHYIPYVVGGEDQAGNFVAACWLCNRHKHAYVINQECGEEELRQKLIFAWRGSGWVWL